MADAARILDETIAQPRPRYFAFVGSSGLEIGVLGDALASCFDANLAVWAGAATEIEEQSVRWVGELIRYPAGGGAFTSGGTISNLTALAAARERAMPGVPPRRPGRQAGRRLLLGRGALLGRPGRGGAGPRRAPASARCPSTSTGGCAPPETAEAIDRDRAAGIEPVAVIATAGTTLTGAIDPIDELADVCARARRVAARRRRVRAARRGRILDPRQLPRARPGGLRVARRAQVALPAQGLRRRARPRPQPPAGGVLPQRGLPAARAHRGSRRGRDARVLPAVPRAQAVAGVPGARRGGVPGGDRAQPRPGAAAGRRRSGGTTTWSC